MDEANCPMSRVEDLWAAQYLGTVHPLLRGNSLAGTGSDDPYAAVLLRAERNMATCCCNAHFGSHDVM